MKLILFTAFVISGFLNLEARERRRIDEDAIRPTEIVIIEYGDPVVEYHVMNKSRELQRQALLAFKLQQFEDANSCYSLALKASPQSKDIIIEYIFCSVLVPITSKAYSLKRAERLMEHLEDQDNYEVERYWIAKALIAAAQGETTEALHFLSLEKSGKYSKTIDLMKQDLSESRSLHWSLLEKLLPIRMSPRDKRSNRR